MSGGLHLGPPGFIFIKFPSTQISADINDATCVSKDGLRVKFGVSFQYQLPMEWVKPVVVKYRNMDKWGGIVYAAGMSAVQHSCSKYDISNFQNKRGIIQSEMESKLRIKLEGPNGDGAGGVYARAISLQLTNVELPEEYREAVSEKQQADEDIELAKNQRTQETTKANTELLAAKADWGALYDPAVLGGADGPPVAALVSYEDIYVERAFSEQTAALLGDSRIDHVAFTGSVGGGRAVHEAASHRFVDTGLELGGKDPAYVAADADLDFTVPSVVDGACYNAGQSCCAVERVYVHQDVYDEFLTRAQAALEEYVLGDPLAPTTTMGPMVNTRAIDWLVSRTCARRA